ncbi:MAG: histidine kinase [Verrucomicrobiaceae bacterium]|nr:histidine kinase [Verrucomicrobiaceae bacterium]
MQHDQITFLSNLAGGCIFLALTLMLFYLWYIRAAHSTLVLAAAVSAVWQFAFAVHYHWLSLEKPVLLILEIARDGAWISALLSCMVFSSGKTLSFPLRAIIQGVWISALFLASYLFATHTTLAYDTKTLTWAGVSLGVVGLVSVEQLYRNSQQDRLIKLLSVAISSLFVYDIYLFSHALMFGAIDVDLWRARGSVNAIAGLFMIAGSIAVARQNAKPTRMTLSRPAVFYTTSLTAAGCFLALMAVGGYYVELYGGSWGTVVQILVLFLALMSVGGIFVSETARSHLNVWINKHFFHHKYDYRAEWLKLINYLSQPFGAENFHERAIKAVAEIFKSPGGALWLRQGQRYTPMAAYNVPLPNASVDEPADSPFCSAMKKTEWVFSTQSPENDSLGAMNELLPAWIHTINDLWLVLPLLTESELLGFMVLTKPELDDSLTWEDLDLLKTVSRQVASYLDRHEAAEMLAESRQFEAFNKLTAFIMHDLKNLIAQQALVVENAAKHRENPAFFEDAIRTIDNSVSRMSNLLRKLQQNESSELRSLELHRVLMEAVKKCKEQKPVPSLRLQQTNLKVNADQDRLIMTLTHIIKNAQDATDSNGFVDITLQRDENDAIIVIEDNGVGMDQDFIKNQLFRPFVTTKSGKGMGIGAYQTREFIASLGGNVTVDSAPGEGTTFTIALPLSN